MNWLNAYRVTCVAGGLETIGRTNKILGSGDDTIFANAPIDLGFSFPFAGALYTDVYVAISGYVQLAPTVTGGADSDNDNTTIAAEDARILIAPWWDRLQGAANPTTDGGVFYEVLNSGTINHRMVIEWDVNGLDDTSGDYNHFRFQLVLWRSGVIEFRYGARTAVGGPPTMSASAGAKVDTTAGADYRHRTFDTLFAVVGHPYGGEALAADALIDLNASDYDLLVGQVMTFGVEESSIEMRMASSSSLIFSSPLPWGIGSGSFLEWSVAYADSADADKYGPAPNVVDVAGVPGPEVTLSLDAELLPFVDYVVTAPYVSGARVPTTTFAVTGPSTPSGLIPEPRIVDVVAPVIGPDGLDSGMVIQGGDYATTSRPGDVVEKQIWAVLLTPQGKLRWAPEFGGGLELKEKAPSQLSILERRVVAAVLQIPEVVSATAQVLFSDDHTRLQIRAVTRDGERVTERVI